MGAEVEMRKYSQYIIRASTAKKSMKGMAKIKNTIKVFPEMKILKKGVNGS